MEYNLYCLDEQITEALCFPEAAGFRFLQLNIVGKAPSMSGLTSSAVRLGNGSPTRGGRFAMTTKLCKICGREFIPNNNRQLTCGNECAVINKRELTRENAKKNYRPKEPVSKNCISCGKEFIPAHQNTKTCSDECKQEHNKNRTSRIAAKKLYEPISCAYCGIEFVPKNNRQKCCCEEHGNALYRQTYKPPTRYTYFCKYCGHKYQTHRKELDQYCSREHADLHRKHLSEQKKQQRLEKRKSDCPNCHQVFIRKRDGQKLCSVECSREHQLVKLYEVRVSNHVDETYACKECGLEFTPAFGNKHRSYCSDECRKRRSSRVNKARRRARIKGADQRDAIDPIEVCKRDGWRCQRCGAKTPKKLRGTIDDRAPEMDHVIPLALGGNHTWDNVQCLCRKCNREKGASLDIDTDLAPHPTQKSFELGGA